MITASLTKCAGVFFDTYNKFPNSIDAFDRHINPRQDLRNLMTAHLSKTNWYVVLLNNYSHKNKNRTLMLIVPICFDCCWSRGKEELEFIKGSIWKLLHCGPFWLPNHQEKLTGSPEEGPSCADCQFMAIICLMRPPDMMPCSWTIRAELEAAGTPTPQEKWSISLIGAPERNGQHVV